MYKTLPNKLWYPGIMRSILWDSRSYIITTPDQAKKWCVRFHLDLYKPFKLLITTEMEWLLYRQVTYHIQEHTKQVSTQIDQGLK